MVDLSVIKRPFNAVVALWRDLRLLRFTGVKEETQRGRSNERYRRALLSSLFGVSAKLISALAIIVTVPVMLHYLGSERYSIWVTLSSFTVMLGFSDLGIGNGLMNALADCDGRGDREEARRYVSSAFFILGLIAAFLLIPILFFDDAIPWYQIFNVKSPVAHSEARSACVIFAICFALNLPLGVVQRIHFGYQESFIINIWNSVGSALSLVGVLWAVNTGLSLPFLVGILAGWQPFVYALSGVVLFAKRKPWLRPTIRAVQMRAIRRIASTGLLFVLLQFCVSIGYYSDALVISHVIGASAVPGYAIPARMFQFAPMFLGFALGSLWPAYSEALARRDVGWVKRTLTRSLTICILLNGASSLVLVIFARPLLHLWVGNNFKVSFLLIVALGVAGVVNGLVGPFSSFLNGLHRLKEQVPATVVMAILNVTLSIWLTIHIGIAGVVLGTVISQVVMVLILGLYVIPNTLTYLDAVARSEMCIARSISVPDK